MPHFSGIDVSDASLFQPHNFIFVRGSQYIRQLLTVGLSPFEMNKVMQQVPSIIEYSVERNLEPKVDFLINDAGISDCALIKAVTARPFILTSSLEQSLKPCVHGLRQRCDLSPQELSDIISRVPVLLSSKWETNLEPKINFLVNYLNLDRTALKRFVLSSPRILTHSIATSLQPKLKILEDSAGGNQAKVSEVVQDNPSLLELSKIALSRRASMLIFRNITFFEAYSSRKSDLLVKEGSNRKPLVRRKKPVFEMSGESVLQSWTDVASAALSIGSSRANMYNILKTRRTYNGKTYVYGTLPEIHSFHTPRAERMVDCDEGAKTLRDILRQSSMSSCTVVSTDSVGTNYTKVNLAAYVSSGVYPSGKEIRGVRQSGGSLMYFPQLKGNALTTKLLRSAIQATIATQVLPDDAGTTYCEGTVLSFFPGTRPSKNRAGLWVCSNALRVVVELLASDPMFETCDVTVDIITDSTYLVALLRDSEALGRWGSHSRRKDFVYDGPEQPWVVNADLLYPLARTFYRVTKQMLTTPKYGNRRKPLANSISIRFRHRSECTWTGDDPKIQNGNKLAKRAAEWQHDREQSQNF